jgi:zinc protease
MHPLLIPWAVVYTLANAPSTSPPKIETHTSANGLTVLVVENRSVPLVSIEIAAKNGSMTEPPEYNGLSHLYEHMFFKANAKYTSQEAWIARSRELGASWNGTTNTERVNYYFTTTSDHFDDMLQFMHDAIVTPKFDAKELDKERVVVTGEIDRNEANPYYHFFHDVQNHVFYKYPSRKDPLGNRKTVLSATVAKMQTIQKRYYVPNNSVLVITGDVSAADVFAKVDPMFADWKKAADPFKKNPLVKHPALKRTEVVLVEQKVQTVNGQLVWHGPSTVGAGVPDTYVADAFLVGLGFASSNFQKALVDTGTCVRANIGWYTQMNTGPITLGFEATPDKVDDCVKAVLAEVGKLKDADYATEDDLLRGARVLEIGMVRDRETPSELAHTLTFWWTSAGLDYYLGYATNLFKVKHDDVVRFVDRWITGKPYVFGVMVSPEMKSKGLDARHFEELIGIKGGK